MNIITYCLFVSIKDTNNIEAEINMGLENDTQAVTNQNQNERDILTGEHIRNKNNHVEFLVKISI